MEHVETSRCFEGEVRRYKHVSNVCKCVMHFQIFVPPDVSTPRPVLWFLAGLTSTDQNFMQKSGVQKYAAKNGVAIICPDTSPRGLGYLGETESYDFGVGAGMYVDSTQEPWKEGYKMYSYVTRELPELVFSQFSFLDVNRQSISGHSMGGHGALICALKNPGKYRSCSAFAPICNVSNVPWGIKTFTQYLGTDKEQWSHYDSTELSKTYKGPHLNILVDQGSQDKFLQTQLRPEILIESCSNNDNITLNYRLHEGYDHGYYFISTFVEDHINYHCQFLN